MSTLNESIIKTRVALQNSRINKSGKNKFQGFTYFELKDFLPRLNELMLENKINDIISIDNGVMTLTLTDGQDTNDYSIPFIVYETPLNNKGGKSMQDIQYLGALNTYYKRYLYLNAFGITDGEVIDGLDNDTIPQKPITHQPNTEYQATVQGTRVHQPAYQEPQYQEGLPEQQLGYRTCECGETVPEKLSGKGKVYAKCPNCDAWVN